MIPPTRSNYRAKWIEFTRRLGSCVTLHELAPTLVDAVVETLGAAGAVLYVADPGDGGLRAAAAVGTGCPAPTLADDDHAPFGPLLAGRAPVVLENGSAAAWCRVTEARVFTEGSAIVPLRWRDEPIGALVIGEPSSGPYTRDDLELMEAIGEHAVGLIVTAQMSERRTRARVRGLAPIHVVRGPRSQELDRGALDPEREPAEALRRPGFQRDALDTVAPTVARMTSLLGRLREAPHGGTVDGSSPEGSGAIMSVPWPFGG